MVQTRAQAHAGYKRTYSSISGSQNRIGFFDLPREIRDQIYHDALISSLPIEVWKGRLSHDYRKLEDVPNAAVVSVQHLCINLLKTCHIIADEATKIFYGKNTFAFCGPHDYQKELSWFEAIGQDNMRYLAHLIIEVRELETAWQCPDGTMEGFEDLYGFMKFDTAHPRHPLLQKPEGDWPPGEIEDIDPKVEAIFSKLGKVDNASALDIELRNVGFGSPGALPDFDDPDAELLDYPWYSMDLPNLVEAWRVAYGSESSPNQREMDITWVTWETPRLADVAEQDLRRSPWDILHRGEDGERVKFVMKRKPLDGPIMAAPPTQFSGQPRPAEEMALEKRYGLKMESILPHTSMVGKGEAQS
ncbi:hypothetical protein ANO11243_035910 [Dothideomycetidae sp. 11243]|nr:hypothetical protein ANO11243_035910 [fungal sp. No.11243]